MPDCVHASVQIVETTAPAMPVDLVPTQAEPQKLSSTDDAVLPSRQVRHCLIRVTFDRHGRLNVTRVRHPSRIAAWM